MPVTATPKDKRVVLLNMHGPMAGVPQIMGCVRANKYPAQIKYGAKDDPTYALHTRTGERFVLYREWRPASEPAADLHPMQV